MFGYFILISKIRKWIIYFYQPIHINFCFWIKIYLFLDQCIKDTCLWLEIFSSFPLLFTCPLFPLVYFLPLFLSFPLSLSFFLLFFFTATIFTTYTTKYLNKKNISTLSLHHQTAQPFFLSWSSQPHSFSYQHIFSLLKLQQQLHLNQLKKKTITIFITVITTLTT